jgi:hypothetical protein
MKNILIALVVLFGMTFAQARFNYGAFYGDITVLQTNTMVKLGTLPSGACLTGIRIGQAVVSTNVICTNSIQIGITTKTNYFLGTTQLPLLVAANISIPTLVSNAFITQTANVPVYGYVTRAGLLDTAIGTYRVLIMYVQK